MDVLFNKSLPARLENLPAVRESLLTCAREQGVAENKIAKLDLALDEILTNIVYYSYADCEETGDILVSGGVDNPSGLRMFVIEVTDTGKPFDVTIEAAYPNISADIDSRQIGGLGIYLVKRMMDMVEYQRRDGKNILRFGING